MRVKGRMTYFKILGRPPYFLEWVKLCTLNFVQKYVLLSPSGAPCGLLGCKNRPALFPARMSYKATKPGLVLFYILSCFNGIVAY